MTEDRNKTDWSNYWQGRTATESGDAMVGVGIERSAELAKFWEAQLEGSTADAKILDLACGAGSVLRHAYRLGFNNLTGIDISEDAINAMKAAIPGAIGFVSPVNAMPFDDKSYDLIVSQFGFEYAGNETHVLATAQEIARLLNPGGKFVAVCHVKDGGIEREVAGHLSAISKLENCGFVETSRTLFEAVFKFEADASEENKTALGQAGDALARPREQLLAWLQAGPIGGDQIRQLGQHLYSGAMDLYDRRQAYALEDITGWLDGMQFEINAYKGRMASMKSAALDQARGEAILSNLENAGFKAAPLAHLFLSGDDEPAAWILKAG